MTTILIDQDLCTRCGICSNACTMGLIDPADENTLTKNTGCKSRHVHPLRALRRFSAPRRRSSLMTVRMRSCTCRPVRGLVAPDAMGYYLRKRRSVRRFKKDPVPKEKILELLDIARYAASGGNGQPVKWIVVHDPERVKKIAGLTIEWMKTLVNSTHPMSGYVPMLIKPFEAGYDVICRGAPHLLFAHIPEGNPIAQTDAIIALTHFDIAAPAFGVGTCWAGFVAMATMSYEPLPEGARHPRWA